MAMDYFEDVTGDPRRPHQWQEEVALEPPCAPRSRTARPDLPSSRRDPDHAGGSDAAALFLTLAVLALIVLGIVIAKSFGWDPVP